jgi:D-arginine dehydrogenase
MSVLESDIIVVGGGIAGASAAAALAAHARVRLLEMEPQPGYHATGRSAAFFAAAYGNRVIRGLTALSEDFLRHPPDGFSEVALIRPRDWMFFGRADQQQRLVDLQIDNTRLEFRTPEQVMQRVPIFAAGYLHGAMWDRRGGDIDVDALLQGFLRLLRRREGVLHTNCAAQSMRRASGQWEVTAGGQTFRAPVIVNAAGAWADGIAKMAGVEPIGLEPLLRSAVLIDPPRGVDIDEWPLMSDADEEFYLKPDAGQIMISPADETPSPPCDAQPDDFALALGVDRFERATGLDIQRVNHRWAGLRTFAPDRKFVVGFDPRTEGFFWLAGQGGYGVQSAPSLAQLSSWLVTGAAPDRGFEQVPEFAAEVMPERLL